MTLDLKFESEYVLCMYIKTLGGRLFRVGGCVRDKVIGIEPEDVDYVVTGVDELPFKRVGESFPVYLVEVGSEKVEVALPRVEQKVDIGYKGFTCHYGKSVSLKQDLYRRDLTINAIAEDVETGEIIDPYSGQKDSKDGYLEPVSEAFKEDPLRVLRVARFAAKYNFEPTYMCIEYMKELRSELESISPERIWKEVEKVLSYDKPSIFFRILEDVKALDILFPEIAALDVPDKHDGTALEHTLRVMDYGTDSLEKFGLLCHDLGKGVTDPSLHPSHYDHDKLGVNVVAKMCDRLKAPNKYKKFGMLCSKTHMKIKRCLEMRDGKFLKFIYSMKKDVNRLVNVSFFDSYYRDGADRVKVSTDFRDIAYKIVLAKRAGREVTGKDLIAQGVQEDAKFGEKLLNKRVQKFKQLLSEVDSD